MRYEDTVVILFRDSLLASRNLMILAIFNVPGFTNEFGICSNIFTACKFKFETERIVSCGIKRPLRPVRSLLRTVIT
jgi:hypothetical protein